MSEIDTSAEAVEQRCELLRLQGMALATHFPRSPRFVGMFDGDIALLRALAAERDALREALAKIRGNGDPYSPAGPDLRGCIEIARVALAQKEPGA